MDEVVQRYTDLTYGILILIGLVSVMFFSHHQLAVGFGIGVFVGYSVHVASGMAQFSRQMDDVEEAQEEAVEKVEETAEKVEETVEKVEETQETIEETRETVDSVDERTERVEDAVNGE